MEGWRSLADQETAELLRANRNVCAESEKHSGRPLFAHKYKSFCCLKHKNDSPFIRQRTCFRPVVFLRLDLRFIDRIGIPTAARHKRSPISNSEELRARNITNAERQECRIRNQRAQEEKNGIPRNYRQYASRNESIHCETKELVKNSPYPLHNDFNMPLLISDQTPMMNKWSERPSKSRYI